MTEGLPTMRAVSMPTVISRSGKRFTRFLRIAFERGTRPSIMMEVILGMRSITAAKYMPNWSASITEW